MNDHSGYLLSVDGGGSKTEFCATDNTGKPVCSFVVGSASYKAVSEERAVANIKKGLSILAEKGIDCTNLAYSVWGMSGCDTQRDFGIYHRIIQSFGIAKQYFLCNDAILAFYAKADPPGMTVVAGTGAIAYAIDKNGILFRSGGWGYGFSDLGAGHWLGNEVLKETLLYCDGCRAFDPLFECVRQKYAAASYDELCALISDIANPSSVAEFSSLVFDCKGSPLCESLTEQASSLLVRLGSALFRKMNGAADPAFGIVLAGSLFKHKDFFALFAEQFSFTEKIDAERIVLLDQSPAIGGIKIAQSMMNQNGNGLHPILDASL